MSMANSSLKYNRSLTGKRKFKEAKDLIMNASGKTELEFKEVSALELARIKDRIRQEAQRKKKRLALVYVSVAVVFLTFILYILSIFQY